MEITLSCNIGACELHNRKFLINNCNRIVKFDNFTHLCLYINTTLKKLFEATDNKNDCQINKTHVIVIEYVDTDIAIKNFHS